MPAKSAHTQKKNELSFFTDPLPKVPGLEAISKPADVQAEFNKLIEILQEGKVGEPEFTTALATGTLGLIEYLADPAIPTKEFDSIFHYQSYPRLYAMCVSGQFDEAGFDSAT